MKVVLCSLKYDNNLGDNIINETSKSIIEDILGKEVEIVEFDMSGRIGFDEYRKVGKTSRLSVFVYKILRKVAKLFGLKDLVNFFNHKLWKGSFEGAVYKTYLEDLFQGASAVVFAGGGLVKYKYQNCNYYIDEITKFCDIHDIPAYIHAAGVEGYDSLNYGSRLLKKALNRSCVKKISTRDDLQTLNKYIDNHEIETLKVSDPAVLCAKVYGVKKKPNAKTTIGIGVCRKTIFLDNGINFKADDIESFLLSLIEKLESEGVDWRLFTNGLDADNDFLYEIKDNNNLSDEKVQIPKNSKELLEIISRFDGIVSFRLHSLIVSYSLGVPSIGIVWNDKVKFFEEATGHPERAFSVDQLDVDKLYGVLKKSLKQGCGFAGKDIYDKTTYNSMKDFLHKVEKGDYE